MISEVLFDPAGPDDGFEFVELFNDGALAIDLAGHSLGWGGADYTTGTLDLDLAGVLGPGQYAVVGGPADPTRHDFAPELKNGFIAADGAALFDVDAGSIGGATPIDAVIYGSFFALNLAGLVDASGAPGAVNGTIGGSGESLARDADGSWTVSDTPTPGFGALVGLPEPGTGVLVGAGLAWLGVQRRGSRGRRRRGSGGPLSSSRACAPPRRARRCSPRGSPARGRRALRSRPRRDRRGPRSACRRSRRSRRCSSRG